ncbi:MAG: membrane protein insertase YidC, partial [Comamonas sp.]
MNDIRRTILWVIFGFSLVLLWDKWQIHNGHKPTFFPTPEAAQTAPASSDAGKPAGSSAVPDAAAAKSADSSAVPGGAAAPAAPAAVAREKVTVSTDLYRLTFDGEGGSLVGADLLKYADQEDRNKPFRLFDESAARVYVAQTGLIGGDFPTHKTVMKLQPGPRELAEGQSELKVVFESPDLGGLKLVKTWTVKRGDYAIGVKHEVVNTSGAAINPQLYLQLMRDGNKPPGESSFYSTFTGPAVYTEAKKYHKVEFKDIENGKAEVDKSADNGYVAMVQHYFASAWLLDAGAQRDIYVRKAGNNLYSVGEITQFGAIAPGASKAIEARLFAGPQIEKTLEAMAPGLELVKDYGWVTILAKPLYWLLDKLHGFLGNWGWSIVALVLLLKIAFFWLNAKAYASMAKMKAINPRIMEMRERLKDKPQQM